MMAASGLPQFFDVLYFRLNQRESEHVWTIDAD
jgi:hypothetical protein